MKGGDLVVALSDYGSSSSNGGDEDSGERDRARLDKEVVRPVVRQVMSELLEQSDGQLSLSQLSSRLVQENVLTPLQARRQQSWLASEAASFLDEGSDGDDGDGGGSSGGSEELEPPLLPRPEEGEEGDEEDIFASMSQLFNLDSSDSSETKRRKALPLSLSQVQPDEGSEHVPEAAAEEAPSGRKRARQRPRRDLVLVTLDPEERRQEGNARLRQHQKRVRTFKRWQMDALPPVWPEHIRTAHCAACGERTRSDTCRLELCDTCCEQRAGGGCGEHFDHATKCTACHIGSRLKGCPQQYCRTCCALRPGGPCALHLREARAADLRRMTLGRHLWPASETEQVRRRVVDLYEAWSHGDLRAVYREVLWLARRRGHARSTWHRVSPLEVCAFALGVAASQPRATPDFMQNMRARCYEWLDAAQRISLPVRSTPATGLLVDDVLAALLAGGGAGNSVAASLPSLLELRLFAAPRVHVLIGLAHERAAPGEGQAVASGIAAYREALAAEDATDADVAMAAAGLLRLHAANGSAEAGAALLRSVCRGAMHTNLPLLLLYVRHAPLEACGEGEADIHLAVLRAYPTCEPSLQWLFHHQSAAAGTVTALLRALLVARECETWWGWLLELLQRRQSLDADGLCALFVEELFTYCEEKPRGAKAGVEAQLRRLLT